jgi:CrcB protein
MYALVALGGAIGSVGRFWMASVVARLTGPGFPWGTVGINILGSLLIGWLAGIGLPSRAPHWQAFAMVGVCGGFTTFSAFSLQSFELLRAGRLDLALVNIAVSVGLCLAATVVGFELGK